MQFEPIPGVCVIGIGHRARQGKDTAAAAIVRDIPGAMRFSFADDLYAYCRVVHGMTTKDASLLQRVGVEMRDSVDVNIWIRAVYAKMLDARPALAVITDVRFPNEFDFVKAIGGTTVRIVREDKSGVRYIDPSRPADHVSEVALENHPWDQTLHNWDQAFFEGTATAMAREALRRFTCGEAPTQCGERYKDYSSGGLLRCAKGVDHAGDHRSGGTVAMAWPQRDVMGNVITGP